MSFCAPPVILSAAKNLSVLLVANLLSHSGLLKILGANGAEDYLYLVAVQDVIDQYEFSAMDHSVHRVVLFPFSPCDAMTI